MWPDRVSNPGPLTYESGALPIRGWSGGAKVLGNLPVPGRSTYLGNSRARAYCTCNRCGCGLFGHFFLSSIFSLFFLPLWETAQYGLKYCLKGPLTPPPPKKKKKKQQNKKKQPTLPTTRLS